MRAQTTLTENAPMILDTTCSFARIWPRHATIRIDIRPEVKPDKVMDCRHTTFADHSIDELYCDPPHLICPAKWRNFKNSKWVNLFGKEHLLYRYGAWEDRQEWLDFVRETNREFHRILKPSGILHYKAIDGGGRNRFRTIHLDELLQGMTNFTVVKHKTTKSIHNPRSGSSTHWLTMKPRVPALALTAKEEAE